MSRRPVWEKVYDRFDPFLPAAEHAWRADRPRSPAGVDFLCEVFRGRIADLGAEDLIPDDLLQRLAYYSGGRARDFLKLIRAVAEQGWIEDVPVATPVLVDRVLDEARRLVEAGLDAGHLEILERAAASPQHLLATDPVTHELVAYGKLLPCPDGSERYYPHPLLTVHLVRASAPGSNG